MSKAVSRAAKDSATISVPLSGVTAIPFGNARPSATSRAEPSAVTTAILPGAAPLESTPLNSVKSKLSELT